MAEFLAQDPLLMIAEMPPVGLSRNRRSTLRVFVKQDDGNVLVFKCKGDLITKLKAREDIPELRDAGE